MTGRINIPSTTVEISEGAFNEIADEMVKAGHLEAVILEADRSVSLDMHGICIVRKSPNVVEIRKGFE